MQFGPSLRRRSEWKNLTVALTTNIVASCWGRLLRFLGECAIPAKNLVSFPRHAVHQTSLKKSAFVTCPSGHGWPVALISSLVSGGRFNEETMCSCDCEYVARDNF